MFTPSCTQKCFLNFNINNWFIRLDFRASFDGISVEKSTSILLNFIINDWKKFTEYLELSFKPRVHSCLLRVAKLC